ncbi:hypothetical protein JCM11491_001909 [Sporobolomyces phaffii]
MTTLDRSLAEQRAKFLADVQTDNARDWTVVMGNEAGDLDSLASSLAYAHFANSSHVALQLTPRTDLYLRPENLESLSRAAISTASLLTIDDLAPASLERLESKFVLVDHNSLLPAFRSSRPDTDTDDDRVVAIIDHHVDELAHTSSATNPRIIDLVGSCSSLVTDHFLARTGSPVPDVPRGLADLLISAVLIDTRLKPSADGGKATPVDLGAVRLLLPHSSFPYTPPASSLDGDDGAREVATFGQVALDGMKERGAVLAKLKEDVSWMNGRDLLRRDYKEYVSDAAPASGGAAAGRSVRYGLSTVPLGLNVWLDKFEPGDDRLAHVVADVEAWMTERELDLCGVLTSYTHIKKKSGKEGKHRRELLVVTSDDRLGSTVFDGFEADDVLQLEEWKIVQDYGGIDSVLAGDGIKWKVWQQGNVKATRKQVAPVLKGLVAQAMLGPE